MGPIGGRKKCKGKGKNKSSCNLIGNSRNKTTKGKRRGKLKALFGPAVIAGSIVGAVVGSKRNK